MIYFEISIFFIKSFEYRPSYKNIKDTAKLLICHFLSVFSLIRCLMVVFSFKICLARIESILLKNSNCKNVYHVFKV